MKNLLFRTISTLARSIRWLSTWPYAREQFSLACDASSQRKHSLMYLHLLLGGPLTWPVIVVKMAEQFSTAMSSLEDYFETKAFLSI